VGSLFLRDLSIIIRLLRDVYIVDSQNGKNAIEEAVQPHEKKEKAEPKKRQHKTA
jgi:hypothetical protein